MAARISVTSNIAKMNEKFERMVESKKRKLNEAVIDYIIASFEIALGNTPADTGQLMSNWKFYVTRGSESFEALPGYEGKKHARDDLQGRLMQAEISRIEQLAIISQDLRSRNIDFFPEGRTRVTVGIKNATPYFDKLDKGKYKAIPPLVNLTHDGFSVQAPRGIVSVSLRTMRGENDFKQFMNVRGAHSG